MTKQEFNQMMKEAGVTIIKRRGSDEGGIYVAIEGMTMGVAGIIGKVLVEISNQSDNAKDCIYSVCKAIVDEVEEQEGQNEKFRKVR